MKMTLSTLMMAATICASAMIVPAMAADGKGGAAVQEQAAHAVKPANASRSSLKQRRAECEKQAVGKTGIERKKFMRECVHGSGAAIPMATPATKPATAARPAAPAKPAEPAKSAEAATPAGDATSHKDAYPPERLRDNARLRARSCIMDAEDQGLTGADRQNFLRNCARPR